MHLELFLSDTTPTPVRNHLVEGIHGSALPVQSIKSKFFTLRRELTINPPTLDRQIADSFIPMDKLPDSNSIAVLPLTEADVLAIPSLSGRSVMHYYNIGSLLQPPPTQDTLRLVGLPHRAFYVQYNEAHKARVRIEPWNQGEWFTNLNAGYITLSTKPTSANLRTALHELGHGFGLDHHQECIMQQGKQLLPKFCSPCLGNLSSFTSLT